MLIDKTIDQLDVVEWRVMVFEENLEEDDTKEDEEEDEENHQREAELDVDEV